MSSDKRRCLTECPQPGHFHLPQKQPVLLSSDPPVPWAQGHMDLLFLGGDQLLSYSTLSFMSGSFHSANARELRAYRCGPRAFLWAFIQPSLRILRPGRTAQKSINPFLFRLECLLGARHWYLKCITNKIVLCALTELTVSEHRK